MKTPSALLILCVACGAALSASQPAKGKLIWHEDWPTAQRIAKQANKPIFAVLVCKH